MHTASLSNSIGGGNQSAACDVRVSQVEAQLSKLADIVDRNRSLGMQLEKKLNQILPEQPEKQAVHPALPQPYIVPLADKIRNLCDELESSNSRLEMIVQQAEI